MDYVKQSSADLALCLFASPAPRGAVRVLAERALSVGGGQITVAIIGSSHFLEMRAGEDVLCELLACRQPSLDALPGYTRPRGDRPWTHRARQTGISYSFDLWRRGHSSADFDRETARFAASRPDRLAILFPEGNGAAAITCLDWRVEGSRAIVTTHHTFPEELAIVYTRSMIDLGETGAQQ